ncbi:N-glycosylase/DNA lyase [Sporobacter termitidis DSM 10068]|uniref:DNA-(apurinic or apyrimidinic site) lyase n=1 Tax=Sporobacter termitidis DSM 10068 TaxID=1123282 RepID=A0A1M5Z7Z2_9FIRM|nr:DNA glycosylase [Sporobacter termitidis]SHI20013.1 N-glycosylase/DNA lyase [Sporobacter termitidis DSM 10068]
MKYFQRENEVEIADIGDFEPEKIFECGQCFRWNADESGAYTGVAMGKASRVRKSGGSILISGTLEDFETVWRGYFDLDRDYGAIGRALSIDDYMADAVRYGAGIRILEQDKWEALCSFILSQCNNIPRIKSIVEKFCALYGTPVLFEGGTYYTFPTAAATAALREEDLSPIRCGFRASSLLEAARAVAEGTVDLEKLSRGTPEEAAAALKKLSRVGDKVASCVMLFGLHMLDAFPVDTWMKKALGEQYPQGLDPAVFSPWAGIAQQYMFHYRRCGTGRRKNTA